MPGLDVYLNGIEGSLRQARRALARPPFDSGNTAADGVIFYALGDTRLPAVGTNSTNEAVANNPFSYPTPNQSTPKRQNSDFYAALRTGRSADGNTFFENPTFSSLFPTNAATLEMPWKSQPTEGYVMGFAKRADGTPFDAAVVTITNLNTGSAQTTVTDGGGFYGGLRLAPGEYVVKAVSRNETLYSCAVGVSAGRVTTTDNLDGNVTVSCSNHSETIFALGTTTVTCTASDRTGNTSTVNFTITVRDTTAPALTLPADISIGTATDSAVVNWTATALDTVSGNTSVICSPKSGSSFVIGLTAVNCSSSDAFGNTVSGSFTVSVVDNGKPAVSVAAPLNRAGYTIGQTVAAAYGCSDAGSGVKTCLGMVPLGAAIDTSSVGTKTFTVTATDNAGNQTVRQISYTVGFAVSILFDQTKSYNAGSTIPVTLQLTDAAGANISSAAVTITAVRIAPGNLVVESPGNSQPGGVFKYENGSYQFNLKTTKDMTAGIYNLVFRVSGDPVEHFVEFRVR